MEPWAVMAVLVVEVLLEMELLEPVQMLVAQEIHHLFLQVKVIMAALELPLIMVVAVAVQTLQPELVQMEMVLHKLVETVEMELHHL